MAEPTKGLEPWVVAERIRQRIIQLENQLGDLERRDPNNESLHSQLADMLQRHNQRLLELEASRSPG
jgi:uncharacterized protein YigA (DUF484 family)